MRIRVAAAAVAALAFAPAAQARPTDVNVVNTASSPVIVREAPLVYGDTLRMSASNGALTCGAIDLADGRLVMLDSVIVSISGGGSPSAWLRTWGETSEGGTGAAGDLGIPLHTTNGEFATHSGQLVGGFPISGGSEFAANGTIARVSVCLRAQATGSTTATFNVSGRYLN